MPQVNSDQMAAILTNFQMRFGAAWNQEAGTDRMAKLAKRIESKDLNETIPFAGAVSAGPQKTTDGVVDIGEAEPYSLTIKNEVWQDGWSIQREAYEDDRLGLWRDKPNEMVASHRQHLGRLIGDLFVSGTSALAYDDTAFFSASRVIGLSGTINNIVSQTGTTTTAFLADVETAQQRFMGFKTDKGRPMGLRANGIAVPTQMYDTAWKALTTNTNVNPGGDNFAPASGEFDAGGYHVVWNPELDDAGDFYLYHIDEGMGRYPFVWTDHTQPKLEGPNSTDGDVWRIERRAVYTTYARYNAGYGEPRLCVKVA